MRYQVLGSTGIEVSRYCLGTMMFGSPYNSDPDDCIRIIHRALDEGINFVNSANWYREGQSESILGRALVGRRDEVVIGTKVQIRGDGRPNTGGASRRRLVRTVEESLRVLQTDRIDLYILAHPDPTTEMEETLSVLNDLVHQGKILAFGCSKFAPEQIVESHWIAERRNLLGFRCEESPYSLLVRHIESGVAPVCERYGMGLIAFSPLNSSWLTGRYREPGDIDLTHPRVVQNRARFDPAIDANRRKLDLVSQLADIARDVGVSLVHLAIAFVTTHPAVTSAIIGPRTMEQLEDLLAGASTVLDDEILDRIDAVVAPGSTVNDDDRVYLPPTLRQPSLRRRSPDSRAAG